jgi:hypothetical protein
MGLWDDVWNTAMGKPSFGAGSKPKNNGPAPLDFRNGVYKDPSRHDENFRYRMQQQINLSRYEARVEVARILHESRGGEGIGKGEFIDGLNNAVREHRLEQHEADAVRNQFHAW